MPLKKLTLTSFQTEMHSGLPATECKLALCDDVRGSENPVGFHLQEYMNTFRYTIRYLLPTRHFRELWLLVVDLYSLILCVLHPTKLSWYAYHVSCKT